MFRVTETNEERERTIRRCARTNPCQAVVLATVHVEWTIQRACILLGQQPNAIIRKRLKRASGFLNLSREWDRIQPATPLQDVLGRNNWLGLSRVFDLRNRVVHGNGGASRAYANEMMQVAFYAVGCVRQQVENNGKDLHGRLPIRRQPTGKGTIKGHTYYPDDSLKQFYVEEDGGRRFYCDVDTLPTRSRLDPFPRYRVEVRIVFGYERRTNQKHPRNASFLRIDETT